jgi:cell pole-organizing protein PopZ
MAEKRTDPGGSSAPQPGAVGQGGADPSMEDILASIRRILNEEEPAPPAEPPAEEPLTLSEDMLVEPPRAAPEPPAAPPSRAVGAEEEPAPAARSVPADPPSPPAPRSEDGLLAPAAAAAAAASVGQLLRTVAAERGSAVSRGGPTIEDIVREEIRPLLKEWLDQHLPPLVERLVRAEIERVVGRALS